MKTRTKTITKSTKKSLPAVPILSTPTTRIALLLILLLTAAIYAGSALHNDFVPMWDDDVNLVENEDIRALSWENVKCWFTKSYADMYYPIKEMMHAVEYALWGLNPAGYHITSLLLHCANVLLVFWFLLLLVQNRVGALVAALVYAVHPMAAECIAWVSARGELLYTTFYLSALIAYYYYILRGRPFKFIALTFLFFVLSGLSKVTAVTLPIALLWLDYYNYQMTKKSSGNGQNQSLSTRQLIVEKLPFFIVSLALGLLVISRRSHQIMDVGSALDKFKTIAGYLYVTYSAAFYIVKFIFPINLSPAYPHPVMFDSDIPLPYWLSPLVLLAIVIWIWRSKTWRKHLIFAFGFYVITIFFTLQIVPIGGGIANDRYIYLPCVGLCFLLAKIAAQWEMKQTSVSIKSIFCRRYIAAVAVIALLFSYQARAMSRLWHDGVTLFSRYLALYPDYSEPYEKLASQHILNRNYEQALALAQRGMRVKHLHPEVFTAAGKILLYYDRYDEALAHFNAALRMAPNDFDGLLGKCRYFILQNNLDSAEWYMRATEATPAFTTFFMKDKDIVPIVNASKNAIEDMRQRAQIQQLAISFDEKIKRGDKQGALEDISAVIAKMPAEPTSYFYRINLYMTMNRPQEAMDDCQKLLEIATNKEEVYALMERIKPYLHN
ncbi:hypothetical protein AGMMS4956_01610 [Bacteroidia bacterium]|nr:hypothetical protein AGMMS4956_01610 [Bacteroidia bacterium]